MNTVANWNSAFPGVKFSTVDKRDAVLDVVLHRLPPPSTSLEPFEAAVYDQGATSECVPSSAVTCLAKQYHTNELNPVFLYNLRDDLTTDSGMSVRNALALAYRYGCATRRTYGENSVLIRSRLTTARRNSLSEQVLADAAQHRIKGFGHIFSREAAIEAIRRFDLFGSLLTVLPIVNGNPAFWDDVSQASIDSPVTYHCVSLIGYDDATDRFELQNSWSVRWNLKGRTFFPARDWHKYIVECWFATSDDRVVHLIRENMKHHPRPFSSNNGDLNASA
jgi:hypothetical protein